MPKFVDANGRAWYLPEITSRMLNTLRDEYKFDLRLALRKNLDELNEALADDELVARVLWYLCRAEAEKAGYTPETWLDLFDGAAFREGVVALLDAVWSFSRGPKKAQAAVAALRAEMGWAEPTPATSISNCSATEPPGSSGSTPATTPSGG